MAFTLEGLQRFGKSVLLADSFPLFVAYLLMIFLAGLWQKFTKPLSLRPVLVVYNFLCTAISLYTLLGFLYSLYQAESVYQRIEIPLLTQTFYWYHVTKKIELLDTVFMVLRHKRRQISFLHVYHHSSMLILSDYCYNLSPWPAIAPVLMLNSMVHIFLYLYYALTALDASKTPSWKRHLTELQIVQFYLDLIYAFYGYLYHNFCIYGFIYGGMMIYLFSSFYYHAYIKAKPVKAQDGAQNGVHEVPRKKVE